MNEPEEEWRDIVGWEGYYEVSSLARIRNRQGKVLKTQTTNQGYPCVTLSSGPTRKTRNLHRILGEAFLPNPYNLPVVRHLNDVKTDLSLANLAWGTLSDNQKDRTANGYRPPVKTHCPQGHPYDEENTGERLDGRYCKQCARERSLSNYWNGREPATRSDYCKRGHALFGANLYLDTRGSRVCRTCQSETQKRLRAEYLSTDLLPDDPRHGTVAGYDLYRCKCEPCLRVKQESRERGQASRRASGLPEGDPRHGTLTGYKGWGCKCARCRKANADYAAESKRRKVERDNA